MNFTTIASGYAFVEAPRVDDDGTVYFSDLIGGGYYRRAPGLGIETVVADRKWIGGAVLDASGAVLCAGQGGLVHVDQSTGAVSPVLSELEGEPIVAINDMEADARGGVFGGTVDFAAIFERGEVPSNGQLFYLSPTGTVRVLREGLAVSNGLAFSPDGRRLYHSESTKGVWVYPLGTDGMPGAPDMFAQLEDSDGLVTDCDGGIWVACWKSALIHRFRPDGVLERTLTLPFSHVVSLAFGGPDLTQLYVATGTDATQPGGGGVVRTRVDVPGLRAFKSQIAAPANRSRP